MGERPAPWHQRPQRGPGLYERIPRTGCRGRYGWLAVQRHFVVERPAAREQG